MYRQTDATDGTIRWWFGQAAIATGLGNAQVWENGKSCVSWVWESDWETEEDGVNWSDHVHICYT